MLWADCPFCGRNLRVRESGYFWVHSYSERPGSGRCPYTWRRLTKEEVAAAKARASVLAAQLGWD